MERDFQVAQYGHRLVDAPDDDARYRMLMHDLPRRFHQLPSELQIAALSIPPPLTGTQWDALLAAVTEHIAPLHGLAIPEWVNEPQRFLDLPWVYSSVRSTALDSVLYAPPAFIRHGAFPDPSDLDARGGEKHAWVP